MSDKLIGPRKPFDLAELISEDLGAFFVAHHILISGVDSVAAIKAYFKRTPEMEHLVDEMLLQLENYKFISVKGDQLIVHQKFYDIGSGVDVLERFLPRLFKLAASRVLTGMSDGSGRSNREGIRYFILPDDRETAVEALALCKEFRAKFTALSKKTEDDERQANGVRLIGFLNCVLNSEDFQ